MADKVSPQIRKARSKILRKLSKQKRRAFYQNHIGKSVRVLMEERNEHGLFQGFTDNYVKVGSQTDLNLSNRFVDVAVDAIAKKEIAVGQVLQVF